LRRRHRPPRRRRSHDHYHDDSDVHLNDDTGIDDDRARYHDDQAVTTTTKPRPKPKPKKTSPTSLQKGSFEWRFPKIVGPLRSLWSVGTNNVVLQGALMNFQAVHGLSWNTGMTSQTWQLILQAATKKQYDPNSYNYVVVNQGQPELLMLYVNGHHVYNSFVNTGVSSAPTTSGTYRFTCATPSRRCPALIPVADTTATPVSRGSRTSTAATRFTASAFAVRLSPEPGLRRDALRQRPAPLALHPDRYPRQRSIGEVVVRPV